MFIIFFASSSFSSYKGDADAVVYHICFIFIDICIYMKFIECTEGRLSKVVFIRIQMTLRGRRRCRFRRCHVIFRPSILVLVAYSVTH